MVRVEGIRDWAVGPSSPVNCHTPIPNMNSLLDRLAALDAARLVAVSGALFVLLVESAWVYSALTGRWSSEELVAALTAGLIGALGLLYSFRLGTQSTSV